MNRPEYSVIVPVYNSAPTLRQLASEIASVFIKARATCEIILVNDHSTDNSARVISDLIKEQVLPVSLINLPVNTGQYNATVQGLRAAQGNYIITIDDDFSPPPAFIKTLMEAEPNSDEILYGEFTANQKPLFRKAGSWAFNSFIKSNLNKQVKGNGSSFRLMSFASAQQAVSNISNPMLLDIALMNEAKTVRLLPIPVAEKVNSSHSITQLIYTGVSLVQAVVFKKSYFRNQRP